MEDRTKRRLVVSPSEMVAAVIGYAVSTGDLAPTTLDEFTDIMDRFAAFAERGLGITDLLDLSKADVLSFVRSRQANGEPATVARMHNRRCVCRYLFRKARALGICSSDPTETIELPPRRPTRARPLTDAEIALCRSHSLFRGDDVRHPVGLALAEATARTYELARVLVRDVDVAAGCVRLGGSPRSEPRTVAFTEWGLAQVKRRLRDTHAGPEDCLLSVRSRKVPRATAAMVLIEVLRAAGIKQSDVRPISIVAWRGATVYAGGASIPEVAALLGLRSFDRTAELIGLRGFPRA